MKRLQEPPLTKEQLAESRKNNTLRIKHLTTPVHPGNVNEGLDDQWEFIRNDGGC
jgi:hypothetical protein